MTPTVPTVPTLSTIATTKTGMPDLRGEAWAPLPVSTGVTMRAFQEGPSGFVRTTFFALFDRAAVEQASPPHNEVRIDPHGGPRNERLAKQITGWERFGRLGISGETFGQSPRVVVSGRFILVEQDRGLDV